MQRIAEDPRLFTYLPQCLERYHVVLGDARLSLARIPPQQYDLMILDAFSSDAIPVHLLTREAVRLYFSRLTSHGLLAFDVSNRYLQLELVLGNLVASEGLVGFARADEDAPYGKTGSHWVVLAREAAALRPLSRDSRWRPLTRGIRPDVWTDDFSNILGVFRWR